MKLCEIPSLKYFDLSRSFQYLKKNDYLVEDPNDTSKTIISVKGKNILHALSIPVPVQEVETTITVNTEKTPEEMFEEWWKTYPSTTAWVSDDSSVKFVGSRSLKTTKSKAKAKYFKLLNQGLKHEDLLGSLKYEIKMKKLDSIKKNQNQMDYFKGMDSYFNSERYLQHIEDYRSNPDFVKGDDKVKARKRNVTDI